MKNLKSAPFLLGLIISLLVFIFGFQTKKQNDPDLSGMHVGVIVSDMEKSLDFYTNVIGMTKVTAFPSAVHGSAELMTEAGLTDGKALDIINLKLNDEPGAWGYKLTKIQDVKSEPVPNSFKPGFRYISIFVKDINPYIKRIKDRNIKLLSKTNPLVIPGGHKVIVLNDPDGALLEIIELANK